MEGCWQSEVVCELALLAVDFFASSEPRDATLQAKILENCNNRRVLVGNNLKVQVSTIHK
jgi:hypothetical protein